MKKSLFEIQKRYEKKGGETPAELIQMNIDELMKIWSLTGNSKIMEEINKLEKEKEKHPYKRY